MAPLDPMNQARPAETSRASPRIGSILLPGAAAAFASSFGLVRYGPDLEYLLPIYGFAMACALVAIRPARELRAFDWAMLGWLLVIVLNPLWSVWPATSWWFSIVVALVPLSLLAGGKLTISQQQWRRGLVLIYAVTSFVSLWIAAEFILNGSQRASGPLRDFNAVGAVIYLVLLPLIGQYLTGGNPGNWRQLLRLTLIALFAFSLFATASRAATGVFALFSIFYAVVVAVKGRGMRQRFALLSLAATAIAVALALNAMTGDALTARHITDLGNDRSTQHRLLVWKSTLEIYQSHPALGSGLGSFLLIYPSVRSPSEISTSGDMAHNDYLQLLAEGGPLLLAGLLLFAAWVAIAAIRLLFGAELREHPDRWDALAITLALCAVLMHATVNFIFYVPSTAVLIALWNLRLRNLLRSDQQPVATGPNAKPVFRWVGLAGGFLFVLLTVTAYSANRFDPDRLQPVDYSVESPRYREALLISRFLPFEFNSLLYLVRAETQAALTASPGPIGDTWAKNALIDIDSLHRWKRYDCISDSAHAWLAHLYGDRLDYPAAKVDPLGVLAKATEANPTCMRLYTDAARIALQRERYEDGLAISQKALRWTAVPSRDPTVTITAIEALAELYLRAGFTDLAGHYAAQVLANDRNRPKAREILEETRAKAVPDVG